ncbi:MAG: hypothetical protein P8182_04635 [Deltaproteobacteria bacterium]
MDLERDFYCQLEILGQLPSEEGREKALKAVFAAMKSLMDAGQSKAMAAALPEWLEPKWSDDTPAQTVNGSADPLERVKILGEYTYRGAADRVLQAVLGSLVEVLDAFAKERIGRSIPETLAPYWGQANSCSMSENMGQFL